MTAATTRRIAPWAALAATLVLAPRAAHAFCGFYVDGAGSALYNDATQVVLMRDGTRTVLSMQNDFHGPPEAFAMVVPVPTVLQKQNVATLDRKVFERIDTLDAPRLVQYWEQDPCNPGYDDDLKKRSMNGAATGTGRGGGGGDDTGVKIEAQFVVGEYDIVILSATDSTGLETWLHREKYAIPAGAAPYLKPYVDGGWKFFVAKVDPSKVAFVDGHAALSPLRFYYDAEDFTLPVRLGLINSSGTQDLIVHVLSPAGRYEVANRPNAFIPTNLDVVDAVKDRFGEFYAALFDRTAQAHPRAVITEYAWDAQSCDPCPEPPLTPAELATLGGDVLAGASGETDGASGGGAGIGAPGRTRAPVGRMRWGMTLTRLHLRYGKDDLGEDLVFRAATPVIGGREVRGGDGHLDQDAQPASSNNFQGRYVIRHAWTGPIACANPVRGVWGGPPPDAQIAAAPPQPAQGLAFVPRGKARLAELVAADVPALDVRAAGAAVPVAAPPATSPRAPEPAPGPAAAPAPAGAKPGCGCGAAADARGGAALVALGLVLARRRRRRPR